MSIQEYLKEVQSPEVIPKVLILLDVLGLAHVENKLNPTLETTLPKSSSNSMTTIEVEDWIDDWRMLFEEKLKPYNLSMGLGNRQNCINRMKLFTQKVSSSIDKIYLATEGYIEDCISKNRKSKLPEYFILPQSSSKIESRDMKTGDLYDWFVKALENNIPKDITSFDI